MILLDFVAANICVYFQYLFMHCVCTNIFWRNCFDLSFKINIVVMIIWSIVIIIINFVLTLLDMAGGLLAPPFFKGQIVKKTFCAKNLKKFLSLLLDLFFVHYASIFIKTI
jgi:hypothetical protein